MDVILDWNLGNLTYNGLITLRLCGFPFVEIGVVSNGSSVALTTYSDTYGVILLGVCFSGGDVI